MHAGDPSKTSHFTVLVRYFESKPGQDKTHSAAELLSAFVISPQDMAFLPGPTL